MVSLVGGLVGLAPAVASAQGIGLPVAGFAAGGTGLTSFYVIGFELGPWQEYLAQELTPSYMLADDAQPVRVSWLKTTEFRLVPNFGSSLEAEPDNWMKFDFEWQTSSDYLWPQTDPEPGFETTQFERQYFAPGFERSISENGILGVSAVIAHQRFSAANLGLLAASTPDDSPWFSGNSYSPYEESAFGTGVRLALRQQLVERLAVDAGFQSRIDMEEFAQFRGVYSQAADLDIPARARVGLAFQASTRSSVAFGVERVMYSDISAFPSRYLPNQFLSLLGDSTSPQFNWEDLTVYTVGYRWDDGKGQQWRVDLSTRTQPLPSSQLLSQALGENLANNAMVVGYSRQTGKRSRLDFNAAYAPSEYAFGGSVLGVTTQDLDQRFEVEAMWIMNF